MSLTAYPTLRLKLTMPQALKLQFLPAIPGSNATAAAAAAEAAAAAAESAANTAVAATANKVDRTGDVMSGFLTLNANPTAALHAATKQYVDGGGGGAPATAEYITASANASLSAERVLTDTSTVIWDFTTPGQAKATTAAGGGNVSNSGTPALDQVGLWVTATAIKGIGGTANQVLRIGGAGTTPAFGAIDLSQAATVTGALRAASFPALTGDVTTAGGALATTIANDAVTYAKMQNASAASVLIGRGSASGAGDPQEITLGTGLSMTGTVLAASGGAGTSDPTPPQGRLTLQTLTPVMTTTQSAKTTIFYTPYVGNKVPIYDGTNMVMTTFAELSVATTDATKSPAAIGASKVNDWFVWSDAGTVRIGHGPDWTSDTARSAGTALTMVNGVLLNNAAITNGPSAQRGTYIGTTRSNASSQMDWIYGGAGTAAVFNVWNAYNRLNFTTQTSIAPSWTYNSTTLREVNGAATCEVRFVRGLDEGGVLATHIGTSGGGSGGVVGGVIAIGFDSTTSSLGGNNYSENGPHGPLSVTTAIQAAGIGYHFVAAVERINGTGTITFNVLTGSQSLIVSLDA